MNDRLLTSDPEVVDRYLAVHAGKEVVRASSDFTKNNKHGDGVWRISFCRPLCGHGFDLIVVDDVDVDGQVIEWFQDSLMCRVMPNADVVVFGNGELTKFLLSGERAAWGFKR